MLDADDLIQYALDDLPYVMLPDYRDLPPCPGLYFVRTPFEILYIGATRNIQNRLACHPHRPTFHACNDPVSIAWLPIAPKRYRLLYAYEEAALHRFPTKLNKKLSFYPLWRYPTDDEFMKLQQEI